ncbi:MAG: recombinase family protein [Clostridia bacterium]|nr:recombinase family protein [Clostridia bacterium]
MKYVACYCRVSTDEQAKFGFSIGAQKDALIDYCRANNYKYELFIDEGISASSMKRPALQKMLNNVNNFDMILFTKLDRLSRNVLDANTINKILSSANCTMKAIDEDDVDTSTADGTFIFNLKVSLAQREIGKTSERIKFVFNNKRKNGEVTSGTTKYGYDIVDKHFVINENQQAKIIDFYKYYLNVAGDTLLSFSYYKENFPNKSYDAYKKMLTETAYIGLYKIYKRDEYIENYIPPLMDNELFNAVQNVNKKKRRIVKNNKEAPITLFDGIFKCNKCGSAMSRRLSYRGNKVYVSYRCWKSEKFSYKDNELYKCDNRKNISEGKIEQYLLKNIKEEANKYIVTNTVDKKLPTKPKNDNSHIIRKKLTKLKDLYLEDLIDKETYKNDFHKLSAELEQIEKEHQNTAPVKKDLSKLKKLINSDFETMYLSLSQAEKRKFWITIIDNIYYENGEIKGIEFN